MSVIRLRENLQSLRTVLNLLCDSSVHPQASRGFPVMCRRYNIGGGTHALPKVFLRCDPHRWHHPRTRRDHRPRAGPQAQEEAIQEIPRRLWTHAAVDRRGDTLEMPPARDRYRHRRVAGHEGSETRGSASQNQISDPAYGRGGRETEATPQRHQRDLARADNRFTLDGIENTDPNFNTYIILPSIDALQEFKVQSGIY